MVGKMADEVSDEIEDALNLIVNTTDQSGNMKKGLKQTIYETVSTFRNLFVKLKVSLDSKTAEISNLEKQVNTMKTQLEECCTSKAKDRGSPCHPQLGTNRDSCEESGATGRKGRKPKQGIGCDGREASGTI